MSEYLHNVPAIRAGLDFLLTNDPVFSRLDTKPEALFWPYMGPGFSSFSRIVLGQQLSTKAASSLWEKFSGALSDISPGTVLAASDEDLRAIGLSRQKISYIKGLAEAIESNAFDVEELEVLSDESVYARVTALKGFGRWSAEMYLMFALARPDIWPAGDLGIQEGLRLYLEASERPGETQTLAEGERFAPHRTAASILLWRIKSIS